MDETKFLKDFENAIDLSAPDTLTLDTRFKELEEWDSMVFLSIIAMCDSEYGVQIPVSALAGFQTIGEIFNFIEKKK